MPGNLSRSSGGVPAVHHSTHKLSRAAKKMLGDGPHAQVEVYTHNGGYVYSYSGTHSGHPLYGAHGGEAPFPTVEAALESAEDPGDEEGNFRGPGDSTGEYIHADGAVA